MLRVQCGASGWHLLFGRSTVLDQTRRQTTIQALHLWVQHKKTGGSCE